MVFSREGGSVANPVAGSVRAGGSELHNIASLSGGLIAQESIKIITGQFIPVDNVCLFDGVKSKTEVLRV